MPPWVERIKLNINSPGPMTRVAAMATYTLQEMTKEKKIYIYINFEFSGLPVNLKYMYINFIFKLFLKNSVANLSLERHTTKMAAMSIYGKSFKIKIL